MEYAIDDVFDNLNSWLEPCGLILICIQDIFEKNKKSHMKMSSYAATGFKKKKKINIYSAKGKRKWWKYQSLDILL